MMTTTMMMMVNCADDCSVLPCRLPCVAKFGHYVDPCTDLPEPSSFTNPSRISVRDHQPEDTDSPTVMVVDPANSTVQVIARINFYERYLETRCTIFCVFRKIFFKNFIYFNKC